VQVAETLDKRAQLANEIIKGVILPQFIILPVILALVWFALSRGLSPLAQLQERIRARPPDDLSPIDSRQVPEEISPLVGSLNDMLERLADTIDAQKRFIADAAHQMKTPLAGMRMQSELALRQVDPDEIHRSLEQLAKSSESATRLVNQLLALARAENQPHAGLALEALDLGLLVREVVQDWVPASFAHDIDLGYEAPAHPVEIDGSAIMLRELLSNLIDNALRYTPRAAASPCACAPAACRCCSKSRTPAPASRRPSARACSSASTASSVPASPVPAWGWRSCARSPSSTAPTSRSSPTRAARTRNSRAACSA
jgi:two-component system sensor histidine kinase TctE